MLQEEPAPRISQTGLVLLKKHTDYNKRRRITRINMRTEECRYALELLKQEDECVYSSRTAAGLFRSIAPRS